MEQQSKRAMAIQRVQKCLSGQREDEAIDVIEALSPKLKRDAEVIYLWSLALEQRGSFPQAIRKLLECIGRDERIDPLLALARCYQANGETEQCLRTCDRVERLKPRRKYTVLIRAAALEGAGRFDEASELLGPHVKGLSASGTQLPVGLRVEWSKLLVQKGSYDEAIELIDETLDDTTLPSGLLNMQLHLRAKACDRKGDFCGAFESADRANEMSRVDFDPELYERQVGALIGTWSRERIQRFPRSNCESEVPVFVAGMPRSGTSLIDQIIDAHPEASGVGELNTIEVFAYNLSRVYDDTLEPPECFGSMNEDRWRASSNGYLRELERLGSPSTRRIVNKALGNNKLVGLIAQLFPRTRIIHAIRDPRDVAISCFMGGFNNRLHPWTTRIEWVAKAWEQSQLLMQHWKEVLDVPILDVSYERLVADPENEFPRIIEFLGLEWNRACLDFHKSKRTVRTLSYDQVNRPLYKSSSGRHANYSRYLRGIEFMKYDPGLQ